MAEYDRESKNRRQKTFVLRAAALRLARGLNKRGLSPIYWAQSVPYLPVRFPSPITMGLDQSLSIRPLSAANTPGAEREERAGLSEKVRVATAEEPDIRLGGIAGDGRSRPVAGRLRVRKRVTTRQGRIPRQPVDETQQFLDCGKPPTRPTTRVQVNTME